MILKRVDLIKIDVEGSELEVLRGSKYILKRFHPKIIFETEFPEKIYPILNSFNYKIKKISKIDYLAW